MNVVAVVVVVEMFRDFAPTWHPDGSKNRSTGGAVLKGGPASKRDSKQTCKNKNIVSLHLPKREHPPHEIPPIDRTELLQSLEHI